MPVHISGILYPFVDMFVGGDVLPRRDSLPYLVRLNHRYLVIALALRKACIAAWISVLAASQFGSTTGRSLTRIMLGSSRTVSSTNVYERCVSTFTDLCLYQNYSHAKFSLIPSLLIVNMPVHYPETSKTVLIFAPQRQFLSFTLSFLFPRYHPIHLPITRFIIPSSPLRTALYHGPVPPPAYHSYLHLL